MKFKTQKGSISLLVLITVLFYSSFLLLLYAKNLNKTTTLVEKVRNMKTAYINSTLEDAYEQILNKNTQGSIKEVSSKNNTDTSVLEINNTNQVTLADYRIYGNGNMKNDEYQEVEYIETTGTQYIDTKLSMPNGFHAAFEIEFLKGNTGVILGAEDDSSPYNRNYVAINQSGQWEIGMNNYFLSGTVKVNEKYSVDVSNIIGNTFFYVNGNNIYSNSENITGRTSKSLYLLSFNSKYGSKLFAKLYNMKIYNDGGTNELLRDYIPCYRKEDNSIGMYDLANNIFYDASGTGTFGKGNDVGGVGDLITDESDANNGKYKIEIKVTNKSGETYSKYIYLNKPLLSGEYIDYATKKVVRNDNTTEDIELPEITTYNEYTKIEVITKAKTPELKITYKK